MDFFDELHIFSSWLFSSHVNAFVRRLLYSNNNADMECRGYCLRVKTLLFRRWWHYASHFEKPCHAGVLIYPAPNASRLRHIYPSHKSSELPVGDERQEVAGVVEALPRNLVQW